MRTIRWSPKKGDIVRLKRGWDRSYEALGVRRAGLPLREGALYEVIEYDHVTASVLTLSEVRLVHITGVRHVTRVGSEQFPYIADRFEPVFLQGAASGADRD